MIAVETLAEKILPSWLRFPEKADLEKMSPEQKIQFLMDQIMPGHIGFVLEKFDEKECISRIEFSRQKTANILGTFHGGAIFTLGDTLAGVYMWAISDGSLFGMTRNATITYLKPVRTGTLHCYAGKKVKEGKALFVECIFKDSLKRTVAVMEVEFFLHAFRSKKPKSE